MSSLDVRLHRNRAPTHVGRACRLRTDLLWCEDAQPSRSQLSVADAVVPLMDAGFSRLVSTYPPSECVNEPGTGGPRAGRPATGGGASAGTRPVLERHGQHVIRLCVEYHGPGARHRLQPLLYLEAGGTVFLDEHDRAAAGRAYGFHRGGIERDGIHIHGSREGGNDVAVVGVHNHHYR